jgi:hypothetical protein
MSSLLEACKQNRLPSMSTLCDYGLDPLALFETYRNLVIHEGITEEVLEHAMKTDTLKNLIGFNVKSGYSHGK